MAVEAGKDIYREKPCGLTIDVCRRIAETMRAMGRIFQAGTQRRSVPNFICVKELVQEGKIGPLTEMHASSTRPRSTTIGCPPSRRPIRSSATGTCGSGRRRGGPITPRISALANAASTTSRRGLGCSTGACIRSISASG